MEQFEVKGPCPTPLRPTPHLGIQPIRQGEETQATELRSSVRSSASLARPSLCVVQRCSCSIPPGPGLMSPTSGLLHCKKWNVKSTQLCCRYIT